MKKYDIIEEQGLWEDDNIENNVTEVIVPVKYYDDATNTYYDSYIVL